MSDQDPFEERLQSQPLRPVPPAWRDDILRVARAAASPCVAPPAPSRAWFSSSWLSALLWPHPKAWAALAALWLLVLGLNFASREPSRPQEARRSVPPSPQLRQLLKQQQQLFAELIGPEEKPAADRTKPAAPQPRSQRREQFLNA
jgi:hypothetical protein